MGWHTGVMAHFKRSGEIDGNDFHQPHDVAIHISIFG